VVLGAEHPPQPEVATVGGGGGGGVAIDDRAVEAAAGAAVRVADDHVTDERVT